VAVDREDPMPGEETIQRRLGIGGAVERNREKAKAHPMRPARRLAA
jgi:hypothetical protein